MEGAFDGDEVGCLVCPVLPPLVLVLVGLGVFAFVGCEVGCFVGSFVGSSEGCFIGSLDGAAVGC